MSSAHELICGSISEISIPHWPERRNLCGLPSRVAESFWMKAKRTFLVIDSGNFCPFNSFSFGLGSNKSIWLTPPSM